MPTAPSSNVFEKHNHRKCRSTAMADARGMCRAQKLRLTPTRARVLEILLETHKSLGAYEILERLRGDGYSSQPPIVYRALDFLVSHGFVHRLERLNAFAACSHNAGDHEPMFLICVSCHLVAETPLQKLRGAIDAEARSLGFIAQSRIVEVTGYCPACQPVASL